MTFKQQLARDIDSVFMNTDEFAEYHRIDGKRLRCVIEDGDSIPNPNATGTHTRTMMIYVKARLLPGRLAPDAAVTVDGKRWTVASVSEELGMYTIKLEAART